MAKSVYHFFLTPFLLFTSVCCGVSCSFSKKTCSSLFVSEEFDTLPLTSGQSALSRRYLLLDCGSEKAIKVKFGPGFSYNDVAIFVDDERRYTGGLVSLEVTGNTMVTICCNYKDSLLSPMLTVFYGKHKARRCIRAKLKTNYRYLTVYRQGIKWRFFYSNHPNY